MKWFFASVGLLIFCALMGTAAFGTQTDLTPTSLDHLIRIEWNKAKIVPAPPVDDARYLRRIYLDITGTIPTTAEITAFLADRSPDKRAKAVDALLDSPRYADHWTNYWDDVLMGRQVRSGIIDKVTWHQWLHAQFEKNVSYNNFVYALLTATGQNSVGGSYARANGLDAPDPKMAANKMPGDKTTGDKMTGDGMEPGQGIAQNGTVNGAVNWFLKYQQNPADLSGTTSKIFLGVQIQCAQCHDHKTEKWKQDDFRRFTACFMNIRPVQVDRGKVVGIRRIDLEEVRRPFVGGPKVAAARNEYLKVPPAALDGADFSRSGNRRQALANWVTAPENPWFAEALVNRMWAHFLGRGFVEPIDDFRPSNPPVAPDALKQLAGDFVDHGYDLKHLIRLICASQVYQLSAEPAKKVDPENALWARFRLKPMGPDEMLDALVTATNVGPTLEKVAGDNLERVRFALHQQFTFLFDTDEESEQKDFEGTIPQALMLLNGNLTNRAVTPIPGTALDDVLAMSADDTQKVEALYLRTLSRLPTAVEEQQWVAFVNAPRDITQTTPAVVRRDAPRPAPPRRNGGPDPLGRYRNPQQRAVPLPKQQAYEDLFWALLNSSEFMFNH